MTLDVVATERLTGLDRGLEIHFVARSKLPQSRAAQRLRHRRHRERAVEDSRCGQATPVDRDRIADGKTHGCDGSIDTQVPNVAAVLDGGQTTSACSRTMPVNTPKGYNRGIQHPGRLPLPPLRERLERLAQAIIEFAPFAWLRALEPLSASSATASAPPGASPSEPISSIPRRSSALPIWRASHREICLISRGSSVCTCSGLMDIGRQEDILTHRTGALKRASPSASGRAEKARAPTGELRGDEEHQLVHEVGGEERSRQRGSALRAEATEPPPRQVVQLILERPDEQLELRILRERPLAEGESPGWRAASTSRASRRGLSARTVPRPTATASEAARSCTSRRLSSPETQRSPGTVTRPSSVTAAL